MSIDAAGQEASPVFDYLIDVSLKQRGLVLLLVLGLAGSGIVSLLNLPIDAVPDITNTQVMALTSALRWAPRRSSSSSRSRSRMP